MSKIDNLTLKMNCVDEIKTSVNNIDSKLSILDVVVGNLVKRVGDMEDSQHFISESFEKNRADVANISEEVKKIG